MSALRTFSLVVAALTVLFGAGWTFAQAAIWATDRFGGWVAFGTMGLIFASFITLAIEQSRCKP